MSGATIAEVFAAEALRALRAGETITEDQRLALHEARLITTRVVNRAPNGRLLPRSKWTLIITEIVK